VGWRIAAWALGLMLGGWIANHPDGAATPRDWLVPAAALVGFSVVMWAPGRRRRQGRPLTAQELTREVERHVEAERRKLEGGGVA
jgi:hypothetical protein